ncbi:hypothetical protein FOA43_000130 [Brettanomyces nanus]|uniref:Metallo-beta-lactamase domain-containing protein n=1 Tax=Eeniella nana TaxID=13502 RepID=A0A875RWI2_EENNA|nr:uncharacterized protein FOA43_000130 [Brettanomyces nanus]QPG72828.1 hypothetical protein FOA43_000130 [Brettanomyces nanus]
MTPVNQEISTIKQSCILQFCRKRDLEEGEVREVIQTKEVITIDDEDEGVEDKITAGEELKVDGDILCPICEIPLNSLSLERRYEHVCCHMDNVQEEKPTVLPKTKKRKARKKKAGKALKPSKRRRPAKPIPAHNILQFGDDRVVVDAFCYAEDPSIDVYLLSHFHSDHYGGLTKGWHKGKVIIATKTTVRLAVHKFHCPEELFLPLEYNETKQIPGTELKVTCLDGNHCPGSGIFILESIKTGEKFLHCGDFRISRLMIEYLLKWGSFNRIYLDTTYLNPQYSFGRQETVINATCKVLRKRSQCKQTTQKRVIDFFCKSEDLSIDPAEFLIVVGTYSIGKERLAIAIAETLGSKIYCTRSKADILHLLEWDELERLLETDPSKAKYCQVHLVPLLGTNKNSLLDYYRPYSNHYRAVVGICATGWTGVQRSEERGFAQPDEYLSKFVDAVDENDIYNVLLGQMEFRNKKEKEKDLFLTKLLRVPYSEHSSFRELFYFINLVPCDMLVPTVNLDRMDEHAKWIRMFKDYKGQLDLAKL